MNITKKKQTHRYREKTSGEKEAGRGFLGVRGKRVIMGLYEIMCVKLPKTVKHYRI